MAEKNQAPKVLTKKGTVIVEQQKINDAFYRAQLKLKN